MGLDAYQADRIIDEARRLLADAATRCHAADRDREDNIHEVRKDLKKARAYWRLMRYALGRRQSKAGNARCKEAAKQLSAARDHVVMLGTLDDLGRDSGAKTAMAVGQAKQAVYEVVDGSPTDGIDWEQVATLIRNDDTAWSGLDATTIDAKDIRRGWKRTRRKARGCFRAARRKPSPEALHDWRKWVKRWLEQEQLLHAGKARRLSRLDTLGDVLGRHHDLAVLAHRLWRNDHFGGKPQQRVRKSIGKRQHRLEREAVETGRALFA